MLETEGLRERVLLEDGEDRLIQARWNQLRKKWSAVRKDEGVDCRKGMERCDEEEVK